MSVQETVSDAAKLPALDVEQMVRDYIALRDAREKLKDEFDRRDSELRKAQERIESALHLHIQETNVKSLSTAMGTVFIQPQSSARVEDRQAFLEYVRNNEAWHLAQVGANKAEVTKHLETHQGTLPPGVTYTQRLNVQIRRK
ncbi:MAG TPA: hypothetical protein VEY09_00315 [Pyrinomonadaceae bacterium]|nr:hypothetical protein [Pyrinomonadaceae bacterium]